jgi:hypothetical protein
VYRLSATSPAADADVGGGGFVPPEKPKEEEAKPESIDPEVV